MSLWLQSLGAELYGYALNPPTGPALYKEGDVAQGMSSVIGDFRDYECLSAALSQSRAEIGIHMAAQPLVRFSYDQLFYTYAINFMGTVHLLELIRQVGRVRAVMNVTTDKCYENKEWFWGVSRKLTYGWIRP